MCCLPAKCSIERCAGVSCNGLQCVSVCWSMLQSTSCFPTLTFSHLFRSRGGGVAVVWCRDVWQDCVWRWKMRESERTRAWVFVIAAKLQEYAHMHTWMRDVTRIDRMFHIPLYVSLTSWGRNWIMAQLKWIISDAFVLSDLHMHHVTLIHETLMYLWSPIHVWRMTHSDSINVTLEQCHTHILVIAHIWKSHIT